MAYNGKTTWTSWRFQLEHHLQRNSPANHVWLPNGTSTVFFAQNDDSNLKLLKHFTSLIFLVCFSQRYKVSFVTLRALLLHRQIGLKLKHLHLIVGLPKIFQTESIRINDSSSPHECLLNLVQSPLVCYQFPLELFGQPFKASWGC